MDQTNEQLRAVYYLYTKNFFQDVAINCLGILNLIYILQEVFFLQEEKSLSFWLLLNVFTVIFCLGTSSGLKFQRKIYQTLIEQNKQK